jgi:serine/threonine-protein kinase
LNHPTIAAIHGLEASSGVRALVIELVEGETLADRIARGPIAIDEALSIAKQIVEARSAAFLDGQSDRDGCRRRSVGDTDPRSSGQPVRPTLRRL